MGNNEVVQFYETDEGAPTCPVCGAVFGKDDLPPWNSYGAPSFDTCFSCTTEFGYDDGMSPTSPIGAFANRWEELRIKWLNHSGWSAECLRQLQDHLGINIDELKRKAGRK